MTYEATIGTDESGRRWLASVTLIAHGPEHAITNATRIPAYTIAEQVALQVAADQGLRDETGNPSAFVLGGQRRGAQEPPTVEELGRDVRAGEDRHTIAEKYGVTVWAADKWLAKARRAGTVPAATRGRPRKEVAEPATAKSTIQQRARGASPRPGDQPDQPSRRGRNSK